MRVYGLISSVVLSLVIFEDHSFAVTNLSSQRLHRTAAMSLSARTYSQSKASCLEIPFEEALKKSLRQTLKRQYDDAFSVKPLVSKRGKAPDNKKKQTIDLEIGYRVLFPLENY